MVDVAAHDQKTTNAYVIHFPAHPARKDDPHYRDFDAFRRATKHIAQCSFGKEIADFSECNGVLELHHAHIEFALQNGVDLKHLESVYPGISDPDKVGAWIESAANLVWLCVKHHRAAGTGAHHASASDYEASKFVRNLIGAKA